MNGAFNAPLAKLSQKLRLRESGQSHTAPIVFGLKYLAYAASLNQAGIEHPTQLGLSFIQVRKVVTQVRIVEEGSGKR
jgi:hypothetical protein